MKNFLEKKFRRKGQQAEKDKTERVTGLGRRTREEIAKWNQMTALRFQTGGRHQTSPAFLRGDGDREAEGDTATKTDKGRQAKTERQTNRRTERDKQGGGVKI